MARIVFLEIFHYNYGLHSFDEKAIFFMSIEKFHNIYYDINTTKCDKNEIYRQKREKIHPI